jgi:glycine hydroxymethyltransferase
MFKSRDKLTLDSKLQDLLNSEIKRQSKQINLIASENITSREVMALTGSPFTNKYAEGYPGKRYYQGCKYYDELEVYAQDLAKELYQADYANVQPHSGANANLAVMQALLEPGDKILSLGLPEGGHLSHGTKVNISGKLYSIFNYQLGEDNLLDYGKIGAYAEMVKPDMIIAGYSAYAQTIDWEEFRAIADKVGALFLADFSHYSGLIAGNAYPSPVPHAHVCTSTTHKSLRGPRGGMILTNDFEIYTKVNKAVFPGTQGGPLMHVIAGKAQAYREALSDEFKEYASRVLINARTMSSRFRARGYDIVGGDTDSHMFVVDFTSRNLNGRKVAEMLEKNNIIVNYNTVPNDTKPPSQGSGIRIGTCYETTKGRDINEFLTLANIIVDLIETNSLSLI